MPLRGLPMRDLRRLRARPELGCDRGRRQQDEFAPILAGAGRKRLQALPAHGRAARTPEGPTNGCIATSSLQTVHQSSELWLKHAWVEVEEATRLVEARDIAGASGCSGANESLVRHGLPRAPRADVAVGVPGRRRVLGHGSGFDSPGFREIRRVSPPLLGAFHVCGASGAFAPSRSTRAGASTKTSTSLRRAPSGTRRRRLAAPPFQGRRADHRRGRRRHAGNAGRAARRPDQAQDYPELWHVRTELTELAKRPSDPARRDPPRARAARRLGAAHAASCG